MAVRLVALTDQPPHAVTQLLHAADELRRRHELTGRSTERLGASEGWFMGVTITAHAIARARETPGPHPGVPGVAPGVD